jgi:DAK2 domain fusion protein YloV
VLDLPAARRWAVTSRALLSDSREHINHLNVFPVPDGDTGTNMFLTVDGALGMLREPSSEDAEVFHLRDGLRLLARGMLLSARGNSGVILSQLALGMSQAVDSSRDPWAEYMAPDVLVDALVRASDVAWAGVSRPVEGTILSVARAAAAGAASVDLDGATAVAEQTHEVARAALHAARHALALTPEQLPRLAEAGVVDAGGAGFVLLLEALETVLSGRAVEVTRRDQDSRQLAERHPLVEHAVADDGAVEVMYVIRGCQEDAARRLREDLLSVGSSVMVVGGGGLWRVHVHLDDPESALDAGSRYGAVEQVSITSLRPTERTLGQPQATASAATATAGLVSCAPGLGLARLFSEAGASVVLSSAGNRASTGVLLQACRDAGPRRLVVLPNDPDTILAARAAAAQGAEEKLDIRVVPTMSAVQGLAAASLWAPQEYATAAADDGTTAGWLDDLVSEMAEAAESVRYAALTVAVTDASTAAGPCRRGQWLGVVDGSISAVHDDVSEVARSVLGSLVAGLPTDPAALTVLTGEHATGALGATIEEVTSVWSAEHPDVEVHQLEGGQRTYHWLLGLE